jgi:putative phosphoesterase
MRIGLITDTHLPSLIRSLDELGPQCADFLRTVDLILHGGDVSSAPVLDWLEQFAPVMAATGNNDSFEDRRLTPKQFVEVEGWRIGMAHNIAPETRPLQVIADWFGRPLDVLVGGHTHFERIRHDKHHVLINSGSPNLAHHKETRLGTVGLLDLTRDTLRAEVVVLGETPGKANPGRPHVLELTREQLALV